jgi:hypothetical protein
MFVKLFLRFHILLVAIGVDGCEREKFSSMSVRSEILNMKITHFLNVTSYLNLSFSQGLLFYSKGKDATCLQNIGTYHAKPYEITSQTVISVLSKNQHLASLLRRGVMSTDD